ncbi:MAG: hypothetical protein H8E89_07755 [Candidatus Nitrosopelagicus sp.]|nr:hypothetical protein [Candidatus Nitrosopelagicus sp.]
MKKSLFVSTTFCFSGLVIFFLLIGQITESNASEPPIEEDYTKFSKETKPPIHVVFEVHSHEDKIIREAGGSPYFEERRDVFLSQLEDIDWLLKTTKKHDAKISFLSVGPWAELCLDEELQSECFPVIRNLYSSGEMIGTHSHNYKYMGSFNNWHRDMGDPSGSNTAAYIGFVKLLIEQALGIEEDEFEINNVSLAMGTTKPQDTTLKHQMMEDHGFKIKEGGEEQVFLNYFNHIPYNPYRPGPESLLEDLDGKILTIPQYPIYDAKVRFGAPIDSSIEHQKSMFLQLYLNWRESDEPKVWSYGWGSHVHDFEKSETANRERLPEILSWLSDNFIGEKSPDGKVIAKFSSYRDVLEDYKKWEVHNPGTSSFNYSLEYTDYSEYPYNKWINQYLRNTIVVEEILMEKDTKVFLLDSNEIPLVLAFSDNPETTLNLSDHFPKKIKKISLANGSGEFIDPSMITINSDAHVFCMPRDCQKILEDESGTTMFVVPEWIKETAEMWASDKIDNLEFVNAITFLIRAEIIIVPDSSDSVKTPIDKIFPIWVKNTAGWWADGLIEDKVFVDAIEFLINQKIIKI